MAPSTDGLPHRAKTDATGRGRPLVLVPGGLTGWQSWQPFVEPLAPGRRVIRTQLLSVALGLRDEPLPDGYSLETESHALLRALDDLDVGEADLVGWSYGASVALDAALDRPERVRSLVLIEPPAIWVLRAHGRLGPEVEAFARTVGLTNEDEVSEDRLERFLRGVGLAPDGADLRSLPAWPSWVEHRRSLRIGDVAIRHDDDVARLRGFDRPALLIKGVGSAPFHREIVDLLARDLPDARLEELPGGHAPHIVSRGPFLAILEAFLAG